MRKWLIGGLALLFALTLITVEVLAVEISARGRIRVKYATSNFSSFSNFGSPQTELNTPEEDADTVWTVRQRLRNWWTFKLNEHLQGVWAMEIGYLEWGQNTPTEGTSVGGSRVGRGSGGGIGADGVNVETKQLYMQFDVPFTKLTTKMGMIGFCEELTDCGIWGDDRPGIEVKGPIGPFDLSLRWLRDIARNFNTQEARQSREANSWWFDLGYHVPDGLIPLVQGARIGTGFYYIDDNSTRGQGFTTETYVTGLNIAAQIGPARIANHFAYGWELSGAASKKEANPAIAAIAPRAESLQRQGVYNKFDLSVPLGPGNFLFTNIFTTGDSGRSPGDVGDRPTQHLNSFPRNLETTDNLCFGAGVEISCGDIIDEFILWGFSPNNDELGLIFNMFGYDVKALPNITVGVRVAPTWSAVGNPNSRDKSQYMGTEITVPILIKLWDGLSIDIRGAYYFLGGFFDLDPTIGGSDANRVAARRARQDPDDIWLFVTRFQYNW